MRACNTKVLSILGVVQIPVKLYTAKDRNISLAGLSKCCGNFVGNRRVCKGCGKELTAEQIGKGFFDGEALIPINEEMLKKIKVPTDEEVVISRFISRDNISPTLYTDREYFLGVNEKRDKMKQKVPNWTTRKDYVILRDTLKATNAAAVGKTVMSNKEEIVAVFEDNGGLLMSVLSYPSQVRDSTEVYDMATDANKSDIGDSIGLVKSLMVGSVEELGFRDEYREQLQKIIAGQVIEITEVKKIEVMGANRWEMAAKMAASPQSKR